MQYPARALALVAILAAAPAAAADKVRFQTDWLPSGEHAMYYGGWQKGIFAEEGIDITITRGYGSGDTVTKLNNWYAGDVSTLNFFNNYIARVDHNLSARTRIYARWNHNYRDGGIKNPWSWETPARQETHNYRRNDGAVLDAVTTLNARTVLSARVAFGRFVTGSIQTPQDITALGLPATVNVNVSQLMPS